MITGIAIENFKGIRERVELKLRPLTLLFGANSSGKSTILHALHYAREIFERHNLDADETISGGRYIDLGGFHQMLHQSDEGTEDNSERDIVIRLELDWGFGFLAESPLDVCLAISEHLGKHVPSLFSWPIDQITSGAIELRVAWSRIKQRPYVRKLSVELENETFVTLHASPSLREVHAEPNGRHPCLLRLDEYDEEAQGFILPADVESETVFEAAAKVCALFGMPGPGTGFQVLNCSDALPRLSEPLKFFSHEIDVSRLAEELAKSGLGSVELLEVAIKQAQGITRDVTDCLGTITLEVCRFALDQLRELRYLGPLRETPTRSFQPPRFADPSRWASGLGAWDALQTGPTDLVEAVSDWLGDSDRLNAGYSIERRRYKEVDLADPLIVQLLTGRAFDESEDDAKLDVEKLPTASRVVIVPRGTNVELRPHDVGIGISQVVPVVVTALEGQGHMLMIEQPELHLHPKLQAELTDLFIEAALGDRKHLVILETHSELIPLRIMRRIRETATNTLPANRTPIQSQDVGIYYVETHEQATVVTSLELGAQGELLDPWPEGFFEEGFRERFGE